MESYKDTKGWILFSPRKKKTMRFKLPDGSYTKTDRERAEVLHKHFHKVFNRKVLVDWKFIKTIPKFTTMMEISVLMSFPELGLALFKLSWHKAPGQNGVSPNALKVLNDGNKRKLHKFINCWLEDKYFEYPEWRIASIKALPKKGDLSDPNNWRGIVLLDVVSKVV